MKLEENLRGRRAEVDVEGRWRKVVVITHLRGPLWLVEGHRLPKRYLRPFGVRRMTVNINQMRFPDD